MIERLKVYRIIFPLTVIHLCSSFHPAAEPQRKSSVNSAVEKALGSTAKGKIRGLPNGSKVYLHYDIAGKEKTLSKISQGDSFSFEFDVPYPCVAKIDFDDALSETSFEFVLENGNIVLTGDLGRFYPANVTGTVSNNDVLAFYNQPEVKKITKQIDGLEAAQSKLEKANAKPEKIEAIGMQCLDKMYELGDMSFKYVREHLHTYASVFLISQHMALNTTPAAVVWATCKNLDKELLTHSKAGINISNKLDELRKSGKFK